MSRQYIIKKVECTEIEHMDSIWDSIEPIYVDIFPWDENGYTPKTEVRVFYTATHMYIQFRAYEREIEAIYTEMNDPVYMDSCVEFFINPIPDRDHRYLNFETNCLGTLNLGIGVSRYDRETIDESYLPMFQIKSSVTPETIELYTGEFWILDYVIPLEFLNKFYDDVEFKSGRRMKGNFYKCGDETKYPHYGCWNKVIAREPDFHRPECFGDLILE